MQKVRIPEQIFNNSPSSPDIRYVTSSEPASDGTMESRHKERLVRIVIEVDGEPRDLWVNVTRGGTLGSTDSPLTDYFDRFEAQTMKRNEDGVRVGEHGLSDHLASEAFSAAQRLADIDSVVVKPTFASTGDTERSDKEPETEEHVA